MARHACCATPGTRHTGSRNVEVEVGGATVTVYTGSSCDLESEATQVDFDNTATLRGYVVLQPEYYTWYCPSTALP